MLLPDKLRCKIHLKMISRILYSRLIILRCLFQLRNVIIVKNMKIKIWKISSKPCNMLNKDVWIKDVFDRLSYADKISIRSVSHQFSHMVTECQTWSMCMELNTYIKVLSIRESLHNLKLPPLKVTSILVDDRSTNVANEIEQCRVNGSEYTPQDYMKHINSSKAAIISNMMKYVKNNSSITEIIVSEGILEFDDSQRVVDMLPKSLTTLKGFKPCSIEAYDAVGKECQNLEKLEVAFQSLPRIDGSIYVFPHTLPLSLKHFKLYDFSTGMTVFHLQSDTFHLNLDSIIISGTLFQSRNGMNVFPPSILEILKKTKHVSLHAVNLTKIMHGKDDIDLYEKSRWFACKTFTISACFTSYRYDLLVNTIPLSVTHLLIKYQNWVSFASLCSLQHLTRLTLKRVNLDPSHMEFGQTAITDIEINQCSIGYTDPSILALALPKGLKKFTFRVNQAEETCQIIKRTFFSNLPNGLEELTIRSSPTLAIRVSMKDLYVYLPKGLVTLNIDGLPKTHRISEWKETVMSVCQRIDFIHINTQ